MIVGRAEAGDKHEDGDKSRRHLLLDLTHPKDFVNVRIGNRHYALEQNEKGELRVLTHGNAVEVSGGAR